MRRNHIIILFAVVVLVLMAILAIRRSALRKPAVAIKPVVGVETVKSFSFSADDALKEWEDKKFKGKVDYAIEKDNDSSCVRAHSQGSASAKFYKIKIDAKRRHPVIRWKWRVDKFPTKAQTETLETTAEHDFAARVYVVFPAVFILNSQVLEYIWAEKLPVGLTGISPYSKNIRLMVLETGAARDSNLVLEERDILADYVKAFGERPEHDIGAIAFMTNAEHTNSVAEAVYDDLEVGYKEE